MFEKEQKENLALGEKPFHLAGVQIRWGMGKDKAENIFLILTLYNVEHR